MKIQHKLRALLIWGDDKKSAVAGSQCTWQRLCMPCPPALPAHADFRVFNQRGGVE